MKKIKKLKLNLIFLLTLMASGFISALHSPPVYAALYSFEIGSIIRKSDGTIAVDYRRTGAGGGDTFGPWQQVTLHKNADGTYTQPSTNQTPMFEFVVKDRLLAQVPDKVSDVNVTIKSTAQGDTVMIVGSTANTLTKASVTQADYEKMQQQANQQNSGSGGGGGDSDSGGGGGGGGGGDCGTQGGTAILKCSDGGGNPIQGMLLQITNAFFAGVGVLCVIGVVLGGILYITAGGDASRTKQGITYVINSVIGLILFIFLFMILNFLVPGGFFNNAGFDSAPSGTDVNDPTSDDFQCKDGVCMTAE